MKKRGNLYQRIQLWANDCSDLHAWMNYLSHEIQNEILKIILRSIVKDFFQAYSILLWLMKQLMVP